MRENHRDAPAMPWSDTLCHWVSGLGAFLCLMAPFLHRWTVNVGGALIPFRFWPGNLVVDGLMVVLIYLLGFGMGGWWWWAAGWKRSAAGRFGALGLFVGGVVSALGAIPQWLVLGLLVAYLIWGVIGLIRFGAKRETSFRMYGSEGRAVNVVFFWVLVLLATISDCVLLHQAPDGWLAALSWVSIRFLTELVIVSLMWMAVLLFRRWAPVGTCRLLWLVLAIAPLLFLAEIILRLLWTKSLVFMCGELTVGGELDIRKAMAGANFEITMGMWLLAIVGLLGVAGFFWLCRYLSRRLQWRQSLFGFARWGALSFVGVLLMSLLESKAKSAEWRQWQFKSCMIHLSPFSSWNGYATWQVKAADPAVDFGELEPVVDEKPDIYLIIVETFRADAIHPENAPFLSRWRDEECQPLLETRAASNATHLSWFSILHGRLPFHWESGRRRSGDAPLFTLLKSSGYRVEFRHPVDMSYKDMIQTHCGKCEDLDVFKHVPPGHPDARLRVTERERRLVDELCQVVSESEPGGSFHLLEIDSPHYPYHWHQDFQPPLDKYDEHPMFPLRPSDEEIERVIRRYHNSIAWVDHLVAKLVNHLKATGRYEDAMIVVTGDHGEEFKEHGSWFHCTALSKEQTQVPILIKWPASMGRGPELGDASHLDILPSVAEAAGVSADAVAALPGRSLMRRDEATSILITSLVSQNGETMVWRRDGYEAAFSWPSPYLPVPPEELRLERLDGPDGSLNLDDPKKVDSLLKNYFPDAFGRVFEEAVRRD